MQDKTISLNAVKDLFCRICMESKICYRSKETCVDLKLFDKLSSVIPQQDNIAEDGTLTIRVADGRKVSRVLVCGDNHFGGLYYPDEESQRPDGRGRIDR